MVNNLKHFTTCLYYMGLFPKYNEKQQRFIPSKLRALTLSITYSLLFTVSQFYIRPTAQIPFNEFKLISDSVMYMVIISWMICNHTVNIGQLTEITNFVSSTKLPFKYLSHVAISYNVIFFGLAIGFTLRFMLSVDDFEIFIWPATNQLYSFQCNHIINITKVLFIALIYCRMCGVNKHLERVQQQRQQQQHEHQQTLMLSAIIQEHNLVNNVVDLFNHVFGFDTLLMKLYEVLNMLSLLDFVLGKNQDVDLSGLYVWCLFIFSKGILQAHLCERLGNEGKRTVNLSYNMLQQYEYSSDAILKKKLFILTQQAVNRYPRFTAWGFFNIDHNMIFTFANLTITYVIVLAQLRTQNANFE